MNQLDGWREWWLQRDREWRLALKRRSEQTQRARWMCQAQSYRRTRLSERER